MIRFFEDMPNRFDPFDFNGVGFCIELIKHYGIRACEIG